MNLGFKKSIKAAKLCPMCSYSATGILLKMSGITRMDRMPAIRTSLVVQRWLGIWKWPTGEKDSMKLLKKLYPVALHLPLSFTYTVLMWMELLTSDGMLEAGNVLYMSLTELVLLIKVINIWYRREEAFQFLDELDHDAIYELSTQDEVQLWRRGQTFFKQIFALYIAGTAAVAITGYVSVLYQQSYELPFSYYVPFEYRNSHLYFYAWTYNVLAMTLCCISNSLLDMMGCYFMFHITLLYRLLSARFHALQHAPEKSALPELRNIFRLHERVRSLTRHCERLVSPYVVSQIALSALIICFSGYRLVAMGWQRNPGAFLTTFQFLSVMVVQIFLPCYFGNELTISAHHLTNSVFNTNWLEYSMGTRKLLYYYMESLKRPVKLRAGKFFEIGLPIFMKTINNAYTFLALLMNLTK